MRGKSLSQGWLPVRCCRLVALDLVYRLLYQMLGNADLSAHQHANAIRIVLVTSRASKALPTPPDTMPKAPETPCRPASRVRSRSRTRFA